MELRERGQQHYGCVVKLGTAGALDLFGGRVQAAACQVQDEKQRPSYPLASRAFKSEVSNGTSQTTGNA